MIEDARTAAEVNRLYWDTDASVSDIAQQLGVSRRALYSALRAESAGARCEACGSELVFANRSARSSGLATCSGCGAEQEVAPSEEPGADDEGVRVFPFAWAQRFAAPAVTERGGWVLAGLTAGLLVGAAAAWLAVRRR